MPIPLSNLSLGRSCANSTTSPRWPQRLRLEKSEPPILRLLRRGQAAPKFVNLGSGQFSLLSPEMKHPSAW
jgi:hypothetical protein